MASVERLSSLFFQVLFCRRFGNWLIYLELRHGGYYVIQMPRMRVRALHNLFDCLMLFADYQTMSKDEETVNEPKETKCC